MVYVLKKSTFYFLSAKGAEGGGGQSLADMLKRLTPSLRSRGSGCQSTDVGDLSGPTTKTRYFFTLYLTAIVLLGARRDTAVFGFAHFMIL